MQRVIFNEHYQFMPHQLNKGLMNVIWSLKLKFVKITT